ncbi:hypothetical protein BGY98DRAFT_981470 [Russula aff. rugulosa BPL654]|nr:hypothetical protein BGY98DRAFT_981470 [Russula aff. rugulosa BPL654]
MPECLCFIFKCADDYYRSQAPDCQNIICQIHLVHFPPCLRSVFLRSLIFGCKFTESTSEYNPSRMITCETTNTHGWYVSGSNSQYVAFFKRGFLHHRLNESKNNNCCWCDTSVAF